MNLIKKVIFSIYMLLVVCIYPLYIQNGYYDLCLAKRNFLYLVSGVTFFMLLAVLVPEMFFKKQFTLKDKVNWRTVNITEKFLLMYCVIVVISCVCSEFQNEALWGTDGWYIGSILLLLMSGLALLTSHFYTLEKVIFSHFMITSSFVFVLGICNRFSFYPIMEPVLTAFISTLGNINWFCGYMSVVAPIGVSLFVLSEPQKSLERKTLFLYCLLTFMTGYCQGSAGVYLWEAVMFLVLLWICLRKMQWIKNWFLALFLWGLSGQIVRVLKYLLPDYYNYEFPCLIDTNMTLVVAVLALIVYIVLQFHERKGLELTEDMQKTIREGLIFCLANSIGIYIILSMINTSVGISFLQGSSLFTWDVSWGTERGVCFSIAFLLFKKMSLVKKMIGIGADSFGAFAYSDSEIAEYLNIFF